jgi:hypothetical protein
MGKSDSVDSLAHGSSFKTPSNVEIFRVQEPSTNQTRLKKVNSMSTNSISSVGQSSSSAASNNSMTMEAPMTLSTSTDLIDPTRINRSSSANSQVSFTKEIRNLLEIAESRAKVLCKVYDSSLNDEENESRQLKRYNQPLLRYGENRSSELLPVRPSDYKSIISTNYINSNKKSSNVISKVKLWDQLLQSGQVNGDTWRKEFILN